MRVTDQAGLLGMTRALVWVDVISMGPGEGQAKGDKGSPAPPQLHPDRDPGNPSLHSRFVELSEAYRVLSREQSRRRYDAQLRSGGPPKSPQTTAHDKSAGQTHRYSNPALNLPHPQVSWGGSFPQCPFLCLPAAPGHTPTHSTGPSFIA